ncbi:uncharacterized protein N7483_011898 [Penicillium malachiteum]|uniref:uncharacterized protein n=1 Tax=Penicillium malachiteum TaxID=1324776 RepID=UPI00254864A8|nr:uncharacterized protein N7483_011898 [Penicillium malachiteum]KAJ5714717.1 hypothetical protein N7483_011898 [Penicillium malachiteum]
MEGFWYPTSSGSRYIVGDKVNLTWQAHAPRISLYETCADDLIYLERNVTNVNFYIWTAANIHFQHNIYGDNGCNFRLQLLSPRGEPGEEVYSSNSFGVSNRTNDDPSPTSYNFYSPNAPTMTLTVTTHLRATTTIEDVTVVIPSASISSSESSSMTSDLLPSTSTTMTLTTASSSADSSSGLSSSSKLGLEIGIPLGLLTLAIIFGLCNYQRLRNAGQKNVARVAEVPADGTHEMGNDTMVSELPGDAPVIQGEHVSEMPRVKY